MKVPQKRVTIVVACRTKELQSASVSVLAYCISEGECEEWRTEDGKQKRQGEVDKIGC
jgi:hypothetical protein